MKREKLTETIWARLLAWLLLAICVLTALASGFGIYEAWEMDMYTYSDAQQLILAQFADVCSGAGISVGQMVLNGDTASAQTFAERDNAEYRMTDADGALLWKSEGFDEIAGSPYALVYTFSKVTEADGQSVYYSISPARASAGAGTMASTRTRAGTPTPTPVPTVTPTPTPEADTAPLPEPELTAQTPAAEEAEEINYLLETVIDPALPLYDVYHWMGLGMNLLWALRRWIYVFAALALLLGLACFLFLLCAAGHRKDREGLTPGCFTGIPLDIVTAFAAAWCFGVVRLAVEGTGNVTVLLAVPLVGLAALALALAFVLWCSSFALRVKLGRWWENTVVFRLLRLLRRGIRALLRGLGLLPLVWRTVLGILALSFLELLVYYGLGLRRDTELFLLFWFLEKLIVGGALLFAALMLRRLQRGGEALAAGDLRYQTDTRRLWWDFRRHGENLNSIASGFETAVSERLSSERMKTELITNVSHDIKTPLTSIINYVDLLKGASDGKQREEYLGVLDRQARRLKKLTEDLIEVSKASTGNMEVTLERSSVGELLRQALGEYSERLDAAGLEAVLTLPEGELAAELDGRLMWRILDNLFSNACKYAQPGTRFYVDAGREGDKAVLRFRNISREMLNVPARELLERFVRGDAARTGEGSGLGLSIARSLTELQGGSFILTVDGDLFKAELAFPAL